MYTHNKYKFLSEKVKNTHNLELYNFTKGCIQSGKDYMLPVQHDFLTISKHHLLNDFKKYEKVYYWGADMYRYQLALNAFSELHSYEIQDSDILTFEEAVQIAKKSTSCGNTFKLDCPFCGKRHKTKGEVFDLHLIELRETVQKVFDGEDVPVYWEVSPKEEIRSFNKIINEDPSKEKQRCFMCGDFILYIISIMLYHKASENRRNAMSKKRSDSAVGSTIFYGGADQIVRDLKSTHQPTPNYKVPKFFFFDVKAMECCMNDLILQDNYNWLNRNIVDKRKIFTKNQLTNAQKFVMKHEIYGNVIDLEGRAGNKLGTTSSGGLRTLDVNTDGLEIVKLYNLTYSLEDPNILQKFQIQLKEDYQSQVLALCDLSIQSPAKFMGDDSVIYDNGCFDNFIQHSMEMGFQMEHEENDLNIQGSVPIESGKFLNLKFKKNNMGTYDFIPNYDKLFASVYYHMKSGSWRLSWAKICAIKILCFTKESYYEQCEQLLRYIKENHWLDMYNEIELEPKIPFKSLESMNLPYHDIAYIIHGFENNKLDDKTKEILINIEEATSYNIAWAQIN